MAEKEQHKQQDEMGKRTVRKLRFAIFRIILY